MTFEQWFLLYTISLSMCGNRQLYKRLNITSLEPEATRGEAFYAAYGDYKDVISFAEQGKLCPIYVWSLQFDYLEKWDKERLKKEELEK